MKKITYVCLALLLAMPLFAIRPPNSLRINDLDYSLVYSNNSLLQYRASADSTYELRFANESEQDFFQPCIRDFKVTCSNNINFSVCQPSYGGLVLYITNPQRSHFSYLSINIQKEDFDLDLLQNTCRQVPGLFHYVNQYVD